MISFEQKQVGYSARELQSDSRLAAELLSKQKEDSLNFYYAWESLQDPSSPRSWQEWLDKQPLGSHLLTQSWNCQIGEHSQSISIELLRSLYQRGRLDSSDRIIELGQSIASLIQSDSIFGKALTYPSPKKDEPFFVPVFPDSFTKQAYRKCQSRYWSYQAGGVMKTGDFKTLQAHFLQKVAIAKASPYPSNSARPHSPISQEEFTATNQVSWKVMMPELFGYISNAEDENTLQETALDDIQVQPYIEGMRLLSFLHTKPQLLKAILERLGPKEQLKAVLTAVFQMLDLHENNIGLAPQTNDQIKAFRKKTFFVLNLSNQTFEFMNSTPFTFDELHEAYLMGSVHANSIICLDDRAQVLSHLPELHSALESPWEWVLFDHDLCFAESNHWQIIRRKEKLWTIFPLRSVFLSMDYKDIPLTDATLAELENSLERDLIAHHDIGQRYSPIRRRLSPGIQNQLDEQLDYLLRQDCYSLTATRKVDKEGLITTVQEIFAQDLAEMKDPIHQEIWKLIEDDLSFVFVYPNDTYETLARRHRQDVEQLRALNSNQPLIPKQKIKITYSLSSPDKFEERFKIAMQLFPKMTWQQQQALKERLHQMRAYLKAYRQLCQFNPNPNKVLEWLKIFIVSSLFSSIDRQNYLAFLDTNYLAFLQQPIMLEEFKGLIIKECRPTLFTLMKAMYRHLADTELLTRLWAENKPDIKHLDLVGHYNFPLETIIQDVQQTYPVQSLIYRLSKKVNQTILKEKNPYFFFDFEDEEMK